MQKLGFSSRFLEWEEDEYPVLLKIFSLTPSAMDVTTSRRPRPPLFALFLVFTLGDKYVEMLLLLLLLLLLMLVWVALDCSFSRKSYCVLRP